MRSGNRPLRWIAVLHHYRRGECLSAIFENAYVNSMCKYFFTCSPSFYLQIYNAQLFKTKINNCGTNWLLQFQEWETGQLGSQCIENVSVHFDKMKTAFFFFFSFRERSANQRTKSVLSHTFISIQASKLGNIYKYI